MAVAGCQLPVVGYPLSVVVGVSVGLCRTLVSALVFCRNAERSEASALAVDSLTTGNWQLILSRAPAVHASVFRANAARELYLFPQRLARAMYAYSRVVRCDAGLLPELLDASLIHVDYLQCLSILGLQLRHEPHYAFADFVSQVRTRYFLRIQLLDPLFYGARVYRVVPVVIDHCVSKHSVEPCDHAFVVAQLATALNATHESRLQ